MEKYIEYNSTSEMHKELMNIMYLCTEDTEASDYHCFCNEKLGECDLCQLIEFCYDPHDENRMDGFSPKDFLKVN